MRGWIQKRNSEKDAVSSEVFKNDKTWCVATMMCCWIGDVTGVEKFWNQCYPGHQQWEKFMSTAEIIKEYSTLEAWQRWQHICGEQCYKLWFSCEKGRFLWRLMERLLTPVHRKQLITKHVTLPPPQKEIWWFRKPALYSKTVVLLIVITHDPYFLSLRTKHFKNAVSAKPNKQF